MNDKRVSDSKKGKRANGNLNERSEPRMQPAHEPAHEHARTPGGPAPSSSGRPAPAVAGQQRAADLTVPTLPALAIHPAKITGARKTVW